MGENLHSTFAEIIQSPNYLTDESEVGSFVGDHMSSGSSDFPGFDISDQSMRNNVRNTTFQDEGNELNKKVNTLDRPDIESEMVLNKNVTGNFSCPGGVSNVITAAIESPVTNTSGLYQNEAPHVNKLFTDANSNKLNKPGKSNNFSVDFGMVHDISLCQTSLDFMPDYSPMGAPPLVSPIHNFQFPGNSKVELKGVNKSEGYVNIAVAKDNEQLTSTNITKTQTAQADMTPTDNGTKEQTDCATKTPTNELIGAAELQKIFTLITDMGTNISKDNLSLKTGIDGKFDSQKVGIDDLKISFIELKTTVEKQENKVVCLTEKVEEVAHQVGLLSAKEINNSAEILKLKQEIIQLEGVMTEKILNDRRHNESKLEIVKGEVKYNKAVVNEMSVLFKESQIELEELKVKYLNLEGAITNNRDHCSQLSDRLVGLAKNMLSGSTTDPMAVKSLLQNIKPQKDSPIISKESLQSNPGLGVRSIPSISSSSLLPPNFRIPDATIRQASPTRVSHEEQLVLRGIFEKEKAPRFDGSAISAPQFIEEVENYFVKGNITSDGSKIRIVGSFMHDVALQWWKRIVKDVYTWQDAKNEILEQYFSEYDRQKFKKEWKELVYEKDNDIEKFVYQALHLLDIVKPKYMLKRRCQAVASRLPDPLMSFLLQKDFNSEKDFMNTLKEAMVLMNFKYDTNGRKNANSPNNGNQNISQISGNGNNVITNPNYKGKPSNFDPNYISNYSHNNQTYNNQNGYRNNYGYNNSNNHNHNNQNQGGRSGGYNGRVWYHNSRSGQRPYYPNRNNGRNRGNRHFTHSGNGNGQSGNQAGVSNITVTNPQATVPPTTTSVVAANTPTLGIVPSNAQDAIFMSPTLFNQLFNQIYPTSTPLTGDGLNQQGPDLLN